MRCVSSVGVVSVSIVGCWVLRLRECIRFQVGVFVSVSACRTKPEREIDREGGILLVLAAVALRWHLPAGGVAWCDCKQHVGEGTLGGQFD